MSAHFGADELDEIRTAMFGLVGYDPLTRGALLAGLPTTLRGLLPGGQAPPAVGIVLDLEFLNGVERLVDGSVPLKRVLANAVSLAGTVQAADVLRRALAEIETGTTGARPVSTVGTPETQEAVVLRDDMVPFGFLRGGLAAAAGVAKLMVPKHQDGAPVTAGGRPVIHLGTGWVAGPGLLLTNHHVINARTQGEPAAGDADLRAQVAAMSVLFDYDDEGVAGVAVAATELVACDPVLDYALVRLADAARAPLVRAAGPVEDVRPGTAVAVNVIQHPDGRPKRFGIRNNLLTSATATELRYLTDTLGGSSGSPVLNDRWEVVGLHCGSTFASGVKFHGETVAYVNVGTQISAVLADLQARGVAL